MKKLAIAAISAVSVLGFVAPVSASSPGNLSSGPDMYQVKNVTKGSAYATSASATCGETVKYSLQLSNSEFGLVSNINVKASLASGNITASGTNAANASTSVAGHVSVSVDKGSLSYVNGSAKLLDVNGNLIANVSDSVVTSGTNVGNLNGSTREFVQFQAKVDCPTTPTTPETPSTPVVAPAKIASTGPTSTIATMFGLGALTAGISYFVQRRRNLLG